MELKQRVRFFALENALKFNGKANPGAVIGKILSETPELKKDMANISKEISAIVNEINKTPLDILKAEWEKVKPKDEPKKEEKQKKDLPDLQDAKMGKVITRLPPEPSKYSHVGHALSFLINYMYAKKYNGKCLLKLEDTNPEKCTQEFADVMIDDLTNYLEIKPDAIIFISDDMNYMYEQAEKLIKKEKAYVCFCDRVKMQDLRHKGIECECRNNSVEKNLKLWEEMLAKKFKEEECTLRLKADMESANQVMRDPVIFRISYAKHFRQGDKYSVWPLYDFENSVEDSKYGVTHVMRSIEFGTMREELQSCIKDALGLKRQIIKEYGRFNIKGATSQGREIRQLIEEGKVTGWDDPSLVTLRALKRRGIVKETLYELVYQVGLSPSSDKNIDWTMISAINRQILDSKVNRYFFIDEPVEITIENAPISEHELKMHPEHPERGLRKFRTHDNFFIAKSDFEKFKDKDLIRLMDCLNFVIKGKKFVFHSKEHEHYKGIGNMIIHWLPVSNDLMNIEIRMPDNTIKKGLAEHTVKDLATGAIVQFTRFGFCRLDEIKKEKLVFWFTNK
jgi:glutamyl-tRNA synthetase